MGLDARSSCKTRSVTSVGNVQSFKVQRQGCHDLDTTGSGTRTTIRHSLQQYIILSTR